MADPEIPPPRRRCSLGYEHDAHGWTSDDGAWWCKTRTWLEPHAQCSHCGTGTDYLAVGVDPDDTFEVKDGALFCKPCATGQTQAIDRADDEADEAWQRYKDDRAMGYIDEHGHQLEPPEPDPYEPDEEP